MSSLDLTVIAIYLGLLLLLGPLFSRFSGSASDYFRGGGSMLWWLVGASALMTTFSAWSFTGAAGKIYTSGTLVFVLFFANSVAYAFTLFVTVVWFRRLRVITVVEAIRLRFGPAAEQFYTWVPLPLSLVSAAVWLYAISLFVGTVFGLPLNLTILVLGAVVTVLALLGGAWAVVASDFLQMLLVAAVSIIMTVLVLRDPAVGGVAGLIEKVPSFAFHWTELCRPSILVPWIVLLALNQLVMMNDLNSGAARFLMVKDEREARRSVLIPMIALVLLPFLWGIPPLAATFLYPTMPAYTHGLSNPEEAAYVVMAKRLLPNGVLGLLISGIFAASLSALDTGLNRAAGIFIRSFYVPILKPQATPVEQVSMGRWLTLGFGIVIAGLAIGLGTYRSLPLFELVLLLASSVGLPIAVPLFLAFFVRRAPSWASWSSTVVGLAFSLVLRLCLHHADFDAAWGGPPFTAREWLDFYMLVQIAGIFLVTGGWFFFCTRWDASDSAARRADRAEFYARLARPLESGAEGGADTARLQYTYLGRLCLLWGVLIAAMALIPNSGTGRISFAAVGAFFALVAAWLFWCRRRLAARLPASP